MVAVHQKVSGSVCGSYKSGFTLIEVLVAIAIIALMATIVVPQLFRRVPSYERKQFIGRLNALAQYARQHALMKHTVHQLFFHLEQRTITIKQQTDKRDATGQSIFAPLKNVGLKTTIKIPEHLQIKQFFIEGDDAMKAFAGKPTQEVWFFVIPEGLSQSVTLNITDTKDRMSDGAARPIGLVLNPFTVQFKVYDTFQK